MSITQEPTHIPEADSDDGVVRTDEQLRTWAEASGCEVEVATDRQLFIDIDTDEQLQIFNSNIDLVNKLFGYGTDKRMAITISSSKQGGEHKHIRIKLPGPRPLLERIALQACLGSDPKRELISIKRAQSGDTNVVVFFEPL